ncbi:MAG TPA: ATP-binding cassette domain-containing protein, partial [Caldithrix sp.]|nr:ATP-binding cassette domain-containing protein [Caldithrix sp.]
MNNTGLSIHINDGLRTLAHIDNFSFTMNKITFLFGESGIGKSMISKAVYGLLDPNELQIKINDKDYQNYLDLPVTRQIKQNGFFVFQEPSSHLNTLLKIEDQLNEGAIDQHLDEKTILQTLWDTTDDDTIKKIIGIYPRPYRPSGGEKQRILLAMAFKKINLMLQPSGSSSFSLFVFDEPTGSLDNHFRNLFLQLLFDKFSRKQFTSLFITHDYSIISRIMNHHQNMIDAIDFKELARSDSGKVTLNFFSPEQYLSWLKRIQKIPGRTDGIESPKSEVLRIHKHFRIYNREYSIYSDAGCNHSTDLIIHRGEMVYLKAGSGVGKTTMAKILMGLQPAEQVEFEIAGIKISEQSGPGVWKKSIWGKKMGMVFQHADEALNLETTVKESLDGLKNKKLRGEFLKSKLEELFEDKIDDEFLSKKVKYLSGGQKQRLNLVRT